MGGSHLACEVLLEAERLASLHLCSRAGGAWQLASYSASRVGHYAAQGNPGVTILRTDPSVLPPLAKCQVHDWNCRSQTRWTNDVESSSCPFLKKEWTKASQSAEDARDVCDWAAPCGSIFLFADVC